MKGTTAGPTPYVPAKVLTVVQSAPVPAGRRVVNLSVNENPFGPAPEAAAAVRQAAAALNCYADTACTNLRAAIGSAFDLDPTRIICGNGSEELLDIVGRVFVRAGDAILFPRHSFLQFLIVADRLGARAVETPVGPDFTVDLDALAAAVDPSTRLIYIANPNNPTGVAISTAEIERFVQLVPPRVVIVVDCAYYEFAPTVSFEKLCALADARPNILLTRTMSKAYGLAACRVGWAYGAPGIVAAMNTMRGIGNVNGLGQSAAIAALRATDHVARVVDHTAEMRSFLQAELSAIGFRTVPCETNFCLAQVPSASPAGAAEITRFLAQNGYLVRTVEDYGLADWIRISFGRKRDMERVVSLIASKVCA